MSLDRPTEQSGDSLEAVIRERVRNSLTTDLDAELVEYQCPNCRERCINPRGSILAESGVCLACFAEYASHGHIQESTWKRSE